MGGSSSSVSYGYLEGIIYSFLLLCHCSTPLFRQCCLYFFYFLTKAVLCLSILGHFMISPCYSSSAMVYQELVCNCALYAIANSIFRSQAPFQLLISMHHVSIFNLPAGTWWESDKRQEENLNWKNFGKTGILLCEGVFLYMYDRHHFLREPVNNGGSPDKNP